MVVDPGDPIIIQVQQGLSNINVSLGNCLGSRCREEHGFVPSVVSVDAYALAELRQSLMIVTGKLFGNLWPASATPRYLDRGG